MTKQQEQKCRDAKQRLLLSTRFREPFEFEDELGSLTYYTLYFLMKIMPLSKLFGYYGICDQLVRSVTSIGANVAEGRGRATFPSVINFLGIARGSLFESIKHIEYLYVFCPDDHKEELFNLHDAWKNKFIPSFEKQYNVLLEEYIQEFSVDTQEFVIEVPQ